MSSAKNRLDLILLDQGLADTRAKAQALILAGRVRVNGRPVTKAGTLVPEGAAVEVLARGAADKSCGTVGN